MPDDFEASRQAFLVAAEDFDVVVHAAEEAEPERRDNHQYEVDVAHTAQQQHGHEYGYDDDYATHRRHSDFLNAEGVNLGVALCLGDLLAFEVLDKLLAEPCRDYQRQDERQQRAERYVAPHVCAGDAKLF